jgi:hypothetical protein
VNVPSGFTLVLCPPDIIMKFSPRISNDMLMFSPASGTP